MEKGAARLSDGRWVPLDSEAWRADSEARLYLSLPQMHRQYHIRQVTKFRGDAAAQRLLEDVAAMRLDMP
jgi:hypothetical protein